MYLQLAELRRIGSNIEYNRKQIAIWLICLDTENIPLAIVSPGETIAGKRKGKPAASCFFTLFPSS